MFKTAIQLSSGAYFLTKSCFRNFVDFFSNSRLEQILFESFVAIFRQHRENSNPSVHRNILKKKFSFWSKPFFSCLRTFTDAILNIQRKRFCQFRQYGIQRIQRNDWIKRFSYKELELFYHFRILNEKSPQLLPEKFVTVVKNVVRCPSYVFRLTYSIDICIFVSFSYFYWLSFVFGWFLFGRVCKTALYVPDDLFEEKLLVWEVFLHFFNRFRILPKDFRSYGDNCIPALSKVHIFRQRNKFRKLFFWKNV